MDGPFMCLDPYGSTDYHVLGTPVFSVINLNFAKNIELLKPWTYINIFKLGMID